MSTVNKKDAKVLIRKKNPIYADSKVYLKCKELREIYGGTYINAIALACECKNITVYKVLSGELPDKRGIIAELKRIYDES